MKAAGVDSQEAEPGDRLGRYEILARLAVGGMGRVYLARALGPAGFEKTVALKTIHPDLASRADFVEMFLDEARIAAQLDHPNVCRVSDFGQAEGTYFIAMEYLVGEPLSAVLAALDRAGAPPSARTDAVLLRIVAEAAEGLHAAHELTGDHGELLGVVHRDVSPHNVFVSYDGGVRIVDFGVASAGGRQQRATGAELKGKLAYMAPEQIQRAPLDRRVDVWALGVVLWEALAGAGLWSGRSEIDLLMSIREDPATLLTRARPDVPVELEAIVMRALEKDPARRWQTAREFGQAIQRWLVGRGEVMGLAEVAGLMATVFPGGRTQKLAVLDRMKLASGDASSRSLSGPRGRASAPPQRPSSPPGAPEGGAPTRAGVPSALAHEASADAVPGSSPGRVRSPAAATAPGASSSGLARGSAAEVVPSSSGGRARGPAAAAPPAPSRPIASTSGADVDAPQAETFVGGRPLASASGPASAGTFVGPIDALTTGPVARPVLGGAVASARAPSSGPIPISEELDLALEQTLPPTFAAPSLGGRIGATRDAGAPSHEGRPSAPAPFAPPPVAVVPESDIVRHGAGAVWRARAPWLAGAAVVGLAIALGAWVLRSRAPDPDEGILATPLASARVVTPTVLPTVLPTVPAAPAAPVGSLPAPITPPLAASPAGSPLGASPAAAPLVASPAGSPLVPSLPAAPLVASPPGSPLVALPPVAPPVAAPIAPASPTPAPRASSGDPPPTLAVPRPTTPVPTRAPTIATSVAPSEEHGAGTSRPVPGGTDTTRPPPERAEPGTLVVTTTGGWADVWSGGASLGSTRDGVLRVELPSGRHTIELRPFGLRAPGAGMTRSVEIEAGGTRRLGVSLEE